MNVNPMANPINNPVNPLSSEFDAILSNISDIKESCSVVCTETFDAYKKKHETIYEELKNYMKNLQEDYLKLKNDYEQCRQLVDGQSVEKDKILLEQKQLIEAQKNENAMLRQKNYILSQHMDEIVNISQEKINSISEEITKCFNIEENAQQLLTTTIHNLLLNYSSECSKLRKKSHDVNTMITNLTHQSIIPLTIFEYYNGCDKMVCVPYNGKNYLKKFKFEQCGNLRQTIGSDNVIFQVEQHPNIAYDLETKTVYFLVKQSEKENNIRVVHPNGNYFDYPNGTVTYECEDKSKIQISTLNDQEHQQKMTELYNKLNGIEGSQNSKSTIINIPFNENTQTQIQQRNLDSFNKVITTINDLITTEQKIYDSLGFVTTKHSQNKVHQIQTHPFNADPEKSIKVKMSRIHWDCLPLTLNVNGEIVQIKGAVVGKEVIINKTKIVFTQDQYDFIDYPYFNNNEKNKMCLIDLAYCKNTEGIYVHTPVHRVFVKRENEQVFPGNIFGVEVLNNPDGTQTSLFGQYVHSVINSNNKNIFLKGEFPKSNELNGAKVVKCFSIQVPKGYPKDVNYIQDPTSSQNGNFPLFYPLPIVKQLQKYSVGFYLSGYKEIIRFNIHQA